MITILWGSLWSVKAVSSKQHEWNNCCSSVHPLLSSRYALVAVEACSRSYLSSSSKHFRNSLIQFAHELEQGVVQQGKVSLQQKQQCISML